MAMEKKMANHPAESDDDRRKRGGNVPTVKLAWLQAFLLVVEHRSHAEAARRLGCDPSTVSRYMRELRRWLRYSPFEREFSVDLTPEGEAFISTAKQVVALLEAARGAPRRKINIGSLKLKKKAPEA
jgi:DNA-binding transcriptional LysR family regulator